MVKGDIGMACEDSGCRAAVAGAGCICTVGGWRTIELWEMALLSVEFGLV